MSTPSRRLKLVRVCVLVSAFCVVGLLTGCCGSRPQQPRGPLAGGADAPESQRVIRAALRQFEAGGNLRAFSDTVAMQAWIKPGDIDEITYFAGSSPVRLDVPGDGVYIVKLPSAEGTVASRLWLRLDPGVAREDVWRALSGKAGGETVVVAEVACSLSDTDAAALPEIAREQ